MDARIGGRTTRCAFAFAGTVLLTRIALLFLLGWFVGGLEFADDVKMHIAMVADPFALLAGRTEGYSQHPPLLALLEAVPAFPLRHVLPDFYAARLVFALYEAIAALFFWLASEAVDGLQELRQWSRFLFASLPVGWMTSVVMAQDEAISAAFAIAAAWLVARRRPTIAVLVCGWGVVAAKIFFLLPLIALVVLASPAERARRLAAGLCPIAGLYAWVTAMAWLRGQPQPLLGFTPTADFGTNWWAWVLAGPGLALEQARLWSGLAAVLGVCIPIAGALWSRAPRPSEVQLIRVWSAMLLWAFLLFYHVNPEYYVMLAPWILLTCRSRSGMIISSGVLCAPWAVNLFYGVKREMLRASGGGKATFVEAYNSVLPVDPGQLLWLAIILSSAGTALLAIVWSYRVWRAEPAS